MKPNVYKRANRLDIISVCLSDWLSVPVFVCLYDCPFVCLSFGRRDQHLPGCEWSLCLELAFKMGIS